MSVLYATALLLPVALTALVARAEVRRGHGLWRAGSVAFMLGAPPTLPARSPSSAARQ